MEEATTKKTKRRFNGTVVSISMQHTAIVRVDTVKVHRRYGKRYSVSKRYACDYRKDDLAVGNKVIIEETRPISKTKRWRIIEKV
jgi:small subunit ribosomal protein S17